MNVAMPRFVDWLITLLVIAFVVAYLWYVVSLFARKAARKRPRTALYNRFGQRIATEENPD